MPRRSDFGDAAGNGVSLVCRAFPGTNWHPCRTAISRCARLCFRP